MIYLAYDLRLGLRRHNLPSLDDYILPDEILNGKKKPYFNEADLQLISTCDLFNKSMDSYQSEKKITKIVSGEKTILFIQNRDNLSYFIQFEFDERSFVGLMNRYRSPKEIREMIRNIFTIRDL